MFQVPVTVVCAQDVALWPYSPGLLVKWVSFLSTLHWPVGDLDLGVGGISYVELLILYELWACERLFLEKAHPRYLRPERPISSGRALLSGTLPLRYCAARFACSTPTWRLPVSGHVGRLITSHPGAGNCRGKVARVYPGRGSGPARKRFRLNRKTPAHLAGFFSHSRPRVWKRLRQDGFSGSSLPDHTRRRCDHAYGGSVHEHDRIGVG